MSTKPYAFIRTKWVKIKKKRNEDYDYYDGHYEYYYYQVVRNYRDENGKVRQKMICHLGKCRTVPQAIQEAERKEASEREKAVEYTEAAKKWYEDFEGHIPLSKEEAHKKYKKYRRKLTKIDRDHRYRRLNRERHKEIRDSLHDEAWSSGGIYYEYYRAVDKATEHENKANRARAKLNRFREVQQQYDIEVPWYLR